jgi:hypothetical protein
MPTSCSALVDPFLAMSETLPPPATDVYFSHYRFSVSETYGLELSRRREQFGDGVLDAVAQLEVGQQAGAVQQLP